MKPLVDDPVLGHLTWEEQDSCWWFDARTSTGIPAQGAIVPDEPATLPDKRWREIILSQIRHMRDHEMEVRMLVAQAALDWWEAEVDQPHWAMQTVEDFANDIEVSLLEFSPSGIVRVRYMAMYYLVNYCSLEVQLKPDGSVHEVNVEAVQDN